MTTPTALLDANVLIAAAVAEHVHHQPSARLLGADGLATAAHCLSEAYSHLTRPAPSGVFRRPPDIAIAALNDIAAGHAVLTLDASQHLDAIRAYAACRGIGPRLYDHLIGHTAMVHGIGTLVTWNTRHLRGLFLRMRVVTPEEWG